MNEKNNIKDHFIPIASSDDNSYSWIQYLNDNYLTEADWFIQVHDDT